AAVRDSAVAPLPYTTLFRSVGEGAVPAVVVDARGELGDVVDGGVGLDPDDLAEVVDRVRCVARAAADAEDEQPSPALAHGDETLDHLLDRGGVESAGHPRRFLQNVFAER